MYTHNECVEKQKQDEKPIATTAAAAASTNITKQMTYNIWKRSKNSTIKNDTFRMPWITLTFFAIGFNGLQYTRQIIYISIFPLSLTIHNSWLSFFGSLARSTSKSSMYTAQNGWIEVSKQKRLIENLWFFKLVSNILNLKFRAAEFCFDSNENFDHLYRYPVHFLHKSKCSTVNVKVPKTILTYECYCTGICHKSTKILAART